ncbi:hypothetical protein RDMS_05525 [Deinococcus sp. RL]|uniref:glycosyltransferase n=1 Tax=Deinococcus sp. RL TaxID=1489678 RepID=UPI0004D4E38F|nr:glycosyltransferase [Deinococcus sp. RL]KEF34681.1 hypothetical protein RDMS_05525 [Deinococcus sp. RL]
MRVCIVLEHRFIHTPDGATYDNGQATYAHFQRYLSAFEEVQVVARSQLVARPRPGDRRVDGPGVRVAHVPFYEGPGGLLRRLGPVLRTLGRALGPEDAVIVRLGGVLGHLAAGVRAAQGRPYAAEVVNDPFLGFAPGPGRRSPLRPLFRALMTALTWGQVRGAAAVQYVTRGALQRRYPPGKGVPAFGVSDVHLPPEAFADAPRPFRGPARHAVLVGALEQPHKGVDVALRALAAVREAGLDAHLTVVGEGRLLPELAAQARALGVAGACTFAGQRSTPAEVRRDLAAAELYLMPSRTEGLPRALLEGMAQALPAIGSEVGGIPELLAPGALVPPGDPAALARVWHARATDPAWLSAQSARNLSVARQYADDVLDRERGRFLRVVRARTGRGGAVSCRVSRLPPLRMLYTTTTPIAALAFFAPQLRHLREQGHDVHLVTPPEPAELVARARAVGGATFHPLPMAREIAPRRDLRALAGMLRIMGRVRPQILNFSTPKAGLLGGLAGVLTGVPLRVYFIHGLRSETAATGALARLRPLLRLTERLTCACAHEVLCVSESNRAEAVALGLVPAHKIRVLGAGSPAGLNVDRYAHPDPGGVAAARTELGLPEGTPVVGFVGRLAPQKGVEELLLAWEAVARDLPGARLLLVGTPDPANPLSARALEAYRRAPGVVQVDFEADMSRLYPLMTLLTLPSRHEGLGMVVLEAGAAGVPAVLTDAPGVRDAGVPGVTCLQVPTGDVPALAGALHALLTDPAEAQRLGKGAQRWVREQFDERRVWALWDEFYAEAWARRQAAPRSRLVWLAGGSLLLLLLGAKRGRH